MKCEECGTKLINVHHNTKYCGWCQAKRKREWKKEYWQRPEVKERKRKYKKEQYDRNEKARLIVWNQLSEREQIENMMALTKEIIGEQQ